MLLEVGRGGGIEQPGYLSVRLSQILGRRLCGIPVAFDRAMDRRSLVVPGDEEVDMRGCLQDGHRERQARRLLLRHRIGDDELAAYVESRRMREE